MHMHALRCIYVRGCGLGLAVRTHGMHGTAQWRSVRMRVSAVRPRVVILRGTHTDTCPPSLIWDSIERAPRLQQKIPSQLANHHPGPGMHPPYGMASYIWS